LGSEAALGAVQFGGDLDRFDRFGEIPRFKLPLQELGGHTFAEVWLSSSQVSYGSMQNFAYGADGQSLLGFVRLAESDGPTPEQLAHKAYSRFLRAARELGYPHIARVWNYLSGINRSLLGLERYQRFSLGRYQAFEEFGMRFDADLPAATAIGIPQPDCGLWVYFLARRQPGVHIENPRQVSAYRYPLQYGPKSPSFSRATLIETGGEALLFISGTASIRGHATVHADDLIGQLQETAVNIEALLSQPQLPWRKTLSQLNEQDHLKVYVRHAADADVIQAWLREVVHPSCPTVMLHGDICRPDLLVEIEGVVRYAPVT
jgi:chorismate lyase/3-hydroxybenzoate synthase